MKKQNGLWTLALLLGAFLIPACGPAARPAQASQPRVLAVETFLADLAQNVAGDRLAVDALIPTGLDPHAFEPTPRDVARIAESDLVLINGAGFEAWLEETLANSGGQQTVVTASQGLVSRTAQPGEEVEADEEHGHADGDPHFWLDPLNAIRYVENIRDAFIAADPAGQAIYEQNTQAYIQELKELDAWIQTQVEQVPPERRLMVTNHESFGYFADRYGFRIVGAVLPSVSTNASPSAQQLAHLVDRIRELHAPVIFLETGSNPQLAGQIAHEARIQVVTGLYSHSITAPDGPAPTYIDMMKSNVNMIVGALK